MLAFQLLMCALSINSCDLRTIKTAAKTVSDGHPSYSLVGVALGEEPLF